MQQLYEKKLMSYPRTSSEHLTEAMIPEVKLTIEKLLKLPEYTQYSINDWYDFTKRHFDDNKVGSHPAIIPTVNVPENLNELSEDEKMLYDLLAKSLIRMIYPKAEIDNTNVIITVNDKHKFKANGSIITQNGWYLVDALPEKKKVLPKLTENQELLGEYSLKNGETEPPKRYTEAELLAAMETAGKKIENEEARTLMKLQKKGLGTDATRVPTIKALFDKEYIAKKGKSIYPTEKGIFIINTLPVEELKSAEMTGELEKTLNDIALGKYDYNTYIKNIKKKTLDWFALVAKSDTNVSLNSSQEIIGKCPKCRNDVKKGKFGFYCTGKCGANLAKVYGKELTEAQIKKLLNGKETSYTSNDKKTIVFPELVSNEYNGKIYFQWKTKRG